MKAAARERVKNHLKMQQNILRGKLGRNKWEMKKMVLEQTAMKRELVVLQELIRELEK